MSQEDGFSKDVGDTEIYEKCKDTSMRCRFYYDFVCDLVSGWFASICYGAGDDTHHSVFTNMELAVYKRTPTSAVSMMYG